MSAKSIAGVAGPSPSYKVTPTTENGTVTSLLVMEESSTTNRNSPSSSSRSCIPSGNPRKLLAAL